MPTRNADQLVLPSLLFLTSIKTLEKMFNKSSHIPDLNVKYQMSKLNLMAHGVGSKATKLVSLTHVIRYLH